MKLILIVLLILVSTLDYHVGSVEVLAILPDGLNPSVLHYDER